MNSIYSFLAGKMNIIIVILGIAVFAALIANLIRLRWHYTEISSVMNWKNTKTVFNRKTKEMEEKTETEKVTPDTIRELQTSFNKTCSWHDSLAQLIPLFPLFGILGTVSGLILQLQAGDMEQMFSSLDVALGTTFWGLIAAIILKALDALGTARLINETEIILEDYDKKFNTAIKLKNIEE